MRITADIIDEDALCECDAEASAKPDCRLKFTVSDDVKMMHYRIMFNNMLKKFQLLNVSDSETDANNIGIATNSGDNCLQAMASSSQPSHPVQSENLPPYLLQYLSKMKEEIKKDVTEEVLHAMGVLHKGSKSETPDVKKKENVVEQSEVVHSGIYCDNCDNLIRGIRYKCGKCFDFDLCEECESVADVHDRNHIFLKIRYPLSQLNIEHNYSKIRSQSEIRAFKAKFLGDETIPDGTIISPGAKFIKSWKISNIGSEPWTKDTLLTYVGGSKDLKPLSYEVATPQLKPGESGIVSINFTAPTVPGHYHSYWSFFNKTASFGPHLWCRINVLSDQMTIPEVAKVQNSIMYSEDALKKEFINVESTAKIPTISCPANVDDDKRKNVTQIAEVLTAVQEEHKRGNLGPRKLVVTSHTATPNNTPFDLSPPKSPEPQETSSNDENSTCADTDDAHLKLSKQGLESEDKASIVSLSSSDSETEFVVIPMPSCFSFPDAVSSSHVCPTGASVSDSIDKKMPLQPCNLINSKISAHSQTQSENVSQETGAPEEAENYNIQTTLHIKEDSDCNVIVANVTVSSSSSGISVIESDSNSPVNNNSPTTDVASLVTDSANNEYSHENDQQQDQNLLIDSKTEKSKSETEATSATTADSQSYSKEEERTIQVLPEGLVTGALLAAATVYNTARAVISSIQPAKDDQEGNLTNDSEEISNNGTSHHERNLESLDPAEQLFEMGFCNRTLNAKLLQQHNGDVAAVVEQLVNLDDNEWYASRHSNSTRTENGH